MYPSVAYSLTLSHSQVCALLSFYKSLPFTAKSTLMTARYTEKADTRLKMLLELYILCPEVGINRVIYAVDSLTVQ